MNSFNFPKYTSSQLNQLEFADKYISGDKLEGPRILGTYELSPSLTQYFGEIYGIISENRSLFSHLAIIAREKGLSVIITNNINKYKVGDKMLLKKIAINKLLNETI